MKILENELPSYVDLEMEKATERILASIELILGATAETTSESKREPLTVRNAQPTTTEPITLPSRKENHHMNILTANRILEKGDQYLPTKAGAKWVAVPPKEWGLQVMFSSLKGCEFRRPGEKPFKTLPEREPLNNALKTGENPDSPLNDHGIAAVSGQPASTPDTDESCLAGQVDGADNGLAKPIHAVPVLAEPNRGGQLDSERTTSGEARESNKPVLGVATDYVPSTDSRGGVKPLLDENGLPTVISTKAHSTAAERWGLTAKPKPLLPLGVPKTAMKIATAPAGAYVTFPKSSTFFKGRPRWTGRNGSFNGYGIELARIGDNISIFPVGKRGVGNCEIQIPKSAIPDFIRALDRVT